MESVLGTRDQCTEIDLPIGSLGTDTFFPGFHNKVIFTPMGVCLSSAKVAQTVFFAIIRFSFGGLGSDSLCRRASLGASLRLNRTSRHFENPCFDLKQQVNHTVKL